MISFITKNPTKYTPKVENVIFEKWQQEIFAILEKENIDEICIKYKKYGDVE